MRTLIAVAATLAATAVLAAPAAANHSWNGYHWARTANPLPLKVGDNLTGGWSSYLDQTVSDWDRSSVLALTKVAGQARGKCRPTSGRVEVCNDSYGQNGWLGIAQIWISGGHIVQGTTRVNDTYFAMSRYNTTTEREHVMCQEVGHDFGLAHQDESGISLNTCMDYYRNTSNSDTKSTSPNQHDYDELATIYAHLDSTNSWSGAGTSQNVPDWSPASWRASTYVDHLPNGMELVTHVLWANPIHSDL